jgi:hypothetical protein
MTITLTCKGIRVMQESNTKLERAEGRTQRAFTFQRRLVLEVELDVE